MTAIVGFDVASKILGGVPINTLKDWRAKGRGPRSAVIAGKVRYRAVGALNSRNNKDLFSQRPVSAILRGGRMPIAV